MSLRVDTVGASKGPRNVPSVLVYLQLLELLLVGGYAYVGNFVESSSGNTFCAMQVVGDYLSFVRAKVAPLAGNLQPLAALRRADEDARTLWQKPCAKAKPSMRLAKVAALWVFAHTADVSAAHDVVDVDPPPQPVKHQKLDSEARNSSVASVHASGKSICRLWNDGKSSADKCKNGRQRCCNFLTKLGKACGQQHRRCEQHK